MKKISQIISQSLKVVSLTSMLCQGVYSVAWADDSMSLGFGNVDLREADLDHDGFELDHSELELGGGLDLSSDLRNIRDRQFEPGRDVLPGRDIDLGRVIRPIPRCAIDPAAQSISFQVLSRTTRFRGNVRITGVIKNLGSQSFVSGAGQQLILLYEDNRLVASMPFSSLASQATASVSFTRRWDSSSPAEGEFPPTYKLAISYDPDIFIDGNTRNDDCSQRNNSLTKSGSEINGLLR